MLPFEVTRDTPIMLGARAPARRYANAERDAPEALRAWRDLAGRVGILPRPLDSVVASRTIHTTSGEVWSQIYWTKQPVSVGAAGHD